MQQTPSIKITPLQAPVIKIEYPDDCLVTLEDAKVLTDRVYRNGSNGPFGIIHVAGKLTTIEDGVREYLSDRSRTGDKIAEAFVIKNLNQRILANFYLRLFRPACPTEVFNCEKEAEKWIMMYCKN